VEVEISNEEAEDALAVPVTALLALAGGGYGVEVREEDGTRVVAVETGLFADGYVQVSGDGIREGTEVVVPA
jgi:multidrug efflux pump subunit AcrA (membrane-fusion protein)